MLHLAWASQQPPLAFWPRSRRRNCHAFGSGVPRRVAKGHEAGKSAPGHSDTLGPLVGVGSLDVLALAASRGRPGSRNRVADEPARQISRDRRRSDSTHSAGCLQPIRRLRTVEHQGRRSIVAAPATVVRCSSVPGRAGPRAGRPRPAGARRYKVSSPLSRGDDRRRPPPLGDMPLRRTRAAPHPKHRLLIFWCGARRPR